MILIIELIINITSTLSLIADIVVNAPEGVDILRIFAAVILLIISALVSGSETAFFSLSPRDIADLEKDNSKNAGAALKLLSKQDYLLATILIANNFVNICVVVVTNMLIDSMISFGGSTVMEFVFKLVIVTFLLLLFGEIMPKIFATYNSMRFVRFIARPLLGLKHLFKPFAFVLINLSSFVSESVAKKRANISIDELSNAIEITSNQSAEEKKMLSGIIDFVHRDVADIMHPRIDIVALDSNEKFDKVRSVVIESGFSRIPVYEETIDNIVGMLYVKDLIPYISSDDNFDWRNLLRKPYFVPEHKKINELLEDFQNEKMHVAIVVDEYGSTLGLVSLEDILEEIVGDIADESDAVGESFYKKVSPDTYIFEGKTHVGDLLKVVGLDDDYLNAVRGEAETLAGVMLEMKRDFLKPGDKVNYGRLAMSVESVEGRRIDKVRVVVANEK